MLRRLELTCYGAFTGRSVDLGPGLTVVLGPNESGKSTLRAAVGDLLWGLQPRKHRYAFKHASGQLKVTADLVDPDDPAGTVTVTVDSRGLWDADGEKVEPWWVGGSVRSRDAWDTALGLTLAALRDGTQAVVDGGGDLQPLVYRARTGVDLEAERERLAARADELYKWHGNNKNVKVRAQAKVVEARRVDVAAATSSADTVVALRAAKARTASAFADAVRDLADASTALAAAERDTRCLVVAHELVELRGRVAAVVADGRVLDSDALAEHDAAVRELAELDERIAELRDAIAGLTDRIEGAEVDRDALDLEGTVEQLVRREASARQARDLVAQFEHNVAAQEAELRRLLRRLDPKAASARSVTALEVSATAALLPDDVLGRLDREAERLEAAQEDAEQARAEAAEAALRSRTLADGLDETAVAQLAEARARRDEAWAQVREPWLAGDVLPADARAALADALTAAHTDLDSATDRAHVHAESTGRAGEADEQAAQRVRTADEADAVLGRARQSWAALLRATGLPTALDPQAWAERRETLDALAVALDALAEARLGLETSRTLVTTFEADVTAAAGPLGIDVGDAWVALVSLHGRVSASVTNRVRQEEWESTRDEHVDRLASFTARRDRVTASLDALRAHDLEAVLVRSREHLVLVTHERDLVDQLVAAAGGGAELDDLVTRLAGRSAADVERARLEALAHEEQCTARHAEAHTDDALAAQELATAERAGSAAALRGEELEAAEQLAALVDEFLQTKVQLVLLDRLLADDAGDDAGGLLAHAESLAQRLTQGRVRRLAVEEVDGRRRLRVDAEALTEGTPSELSEGTADQVYLALRLAGIREQQEASRADGVPALPVVLDDVLQAHDDARTEAAVAVLVEEARDQQIVLLTHHESVAAAALAAGATVVRLEPLPDLAAAAAQAPAKKRPRTVRAVPDRIVAEVGEQLLVEQDVLEAYKATHDTLPTAPSATDAATS